MAVKIIYFVHGTTTDNAEHKSQLALEVITKGISWNEAIEKDWRKIKARQPGWDYLVK